MICPNCRCHNPNVADVCGYCGSALPLGDESTVSVRPRYRRARGESDYTTDYGYRNIQPAYYYGYDGAVSEHEGLSSTETALLLMLCVSLIVVLILFAILIMII